MNTNIKSDQHSTGDERRSFLKDLCHQLVEQLSLQELWLSLPGAPSEFEKDWTNVPFLIPWSRLEAMMKERLTEPEQIDPAESTGGNGQATRIGAESSFAWSSVPIPLVGFGKGVLLAVRKYPFHVEDLCHLERTASRLALPLEHALMGFEIQKINHFRTTIETMHSLSLRISSTLDIKEVLDLLVGSTLQLIPADAAQIFILDPEKPVEERLQFGASFWREGLIEPEADVPRVDGFTAQVAKSAQPIVIERAREHPLFNQPEASTWGVEAIAGFPLIHGGRPLGVFTVTFLKPHTFSIDERYLLSLFAGQAAVAINNAKVTDKLNRRLDELHTIFELSRSINQKLELENIFTTAHQAVSTLMPAEAFYIILRDQMNNDMVAVFILDKGVKYPAIRFPSESGLSGYVVRTAKPVHIRDLAIQSPPSEVFHYGDKEKVRSVLAVPLLYGERTIGMLSTQSYKPFVYSEHDLHLLQNIADIVAIAIENSHLYTDLQKRYRGLQEIDGARTELIQNVSHELRNPLTYLTSYIELLLQNQLGELNDGQRQGLEIVKNKTSTLVRLVEDITSLESKVENRLRIKTISLLNLIRNVISAAEPVVKKRQIQIELQAPVSLPPVEIDPERISQVMDNLLSNAYKFSPSGSKIVVRIEKHPEHAQVSISNEGQGIPDEEQKLIFERFYRVEKIPGQNQSGSGLGLAIVKHFIEAHGGKVWVENQSGEGVTFLFTLPYRYLAFSESETEGGKA